MRTLACFALVFALLPTAARSQEPPPAGQQEALERLVN